MSLQGALTAFRSAAVLLAIVISLDAVAQCAPIVNYSNDPDLAAALS